MKIKLFFFSIFIILFSQFHAEAVQPALIDIEESPSPFILNIQQIQIPGYPNACNPSIVRWNDGILMSFRDIYDPISNGSDGSGLAFSNIGLIWLDNNFNPIGNPQFIEFHAESSLPSMSEDPRLIIWNNALFMVYSDNKRLDFGIDGTRMYIAEIDQDSQGQFFVVNQVCLSDFEQNSRFLKEKNWAPFVYDNQLFFSYSLIPHRILEATFGSSSCNTVNLTRAIVNWNWGVLRGGTPALQIDSNHYLGFFHSVIKKPTLQSNGLTVQHYFMGAYTFSSQPPFQLTQISDNPLIARGFYSGAEYQPFWNPIKVVFPCGFIFDTSTIWLAYGRQDHEIWIATIDREGLMNSLKPVRTRRLH